MKISTDKRRILIVNTIVGALCLGLIVWIWPTFSSMFAPFMVAIILAYLLNPLVRSLERRGLSHGPAVVLIVLAVVAALILAFMSFIPSLINNIATFVTELPSMIRNLSGYTQQIEDFVSRYNASGLNRFVDLNEGLSRLAAFGGSAFQGISNFIIVNSGQVMNLIIIPLVMIMLLLDKDIFVTSIMYVIPIDFRIQAKKMFGDIDMVIGGFIRGQGIISIVTGVMTGLGAWIIGLPYATVIGVIAGVTMMIPYFGPFVGIVIICIIALLASPMKMVYLLIWFCVVQLFAGNILGPAVMAGDVGLHPVIIIFSIFFFGQLFGGVGMLLAVPIMGTIRVLATYLVAGFAQSIKPWQIK